MVSVTAATAALSAAACGDGLAAADGGAPALVALDTLPLAEHDSLYVGRPRSLFVDPDDGTLYVSDAFSGRVVRFGPDGSALRVYGGRGSGPGQLRNVGLVFRLDSLVIVEDVGNGALNLFREDGAYLKSVRFSGTLGSVLVGEDTVWLGLQNLTRRTGLARWSPSMGDSLEYFSALPQEYVTSEPLAGIYTGSALVRTADTLIVGYAGLNDLRLSRSNGDLVSRVRVPRRERRGVPDDVVNRLSRLSFPEMFSLSSVLFGIHRLDDGRVVLVHYDQEINQSRNIVADVFVSVLSADRSRACVDGRLPLPRESQPQIAFRGDTLFALYQALEGERSRALVTRYRIDEGPCDWLPVD